MIAWIAYGLAWQSAAGIVRIAEMPIAMGAGSLAGPGTIAAIESGLLPTPERDLLLALAYQQDGNSDKAQELYRRTPQFAESWNNLGVLLKQSGKEAEGRQAFEHALELDPKLAEAGLNLGRPQESFWTALHEKNVDRKSVV